MTSPPLPGIDDAIDRVGRLWQDLRGGRMFVTGGTGFVGQWLLETFVRANSRLRLNASATVLTRRAGVFERRAPHLAAAGCISLLEGDVRRFGDPGGAFTHVIHGAATPSLRGDPHEAADMVDTIVAGTERALELSRRAGVGRLLLLSSGAVYGVQPPEMAAIEETYSGVPDPAQPGSAYGEAKRIAELLCVLGGVPFSIARCFTFVGPHLPMDGPYAAGNFIRDALHRRPIDVRGDGAALRSYQYAGDMACWLWTLLFRGRCSEAYNVGAEEAVSIARLAELVAAASNPPLPVQIIGVRANGISRYIPSTSKALREFALTSTVGLEQAITWTLDYYRGASAGPER